MTTFLSVAAAVTGVLGLSWTLVPEPWLALWGLPADAGAVYLGRRFGGLFFGYAVTLWLARGAGPSPLRTAILAGGTAVASVMTLLSLYGVVSGIAGPFAWGAVVFEALLAAGFGWFYSKEG